MEKKADFPIEFCEECGHLEYSPIRDAICSKMDKYLWLNDGEILEGEGISSYKYMPKWCPLEDYG